MIPSQTLSRFIRGEERKHWSATGELSDLICAIALGVKMIGALVATSGFRGLQGYTGRKNIQGEAVAKLDEEADRILVEVLGSSGHFGLLVSEEREKVIHSAPGFKDAKYVVAFDPLDGSTNLHYNIPVGTIFTVFKKHQIRGEATTQDLLQPGRNVIAAGYAVYGSKTTFVYSCGDGVHGFTLDPAIGEFMLTEESIVCPKRGGMFSVNEGYTERWSPQVRRFVSTLKSVNPKIGTPYSSRYVGSMVADIDRILRRGGIFLYPADSDQPDGKLRLLYECIPLSYILEQAGGRAVDGLNDILEIHPENIHQRSPLIIGSADEVQWYIDLVNGPETAARARKQRRRPPARQVKKRLRQKARKR